MHRRTRLSAAYIARLVIAAVVAYLIALRFPGIGVPVLAPLTALLVLEVTLYQTLRNALRRVASVIAGVLVAVAASEVLGFTWWSLGATILAALVVGQFLRLGEHLLEVPISAMLVLSLGATPSVATGRIAETIIGAGVGMIAGLVHAPLRLQPAEEAIDDLWRQLAGLLAQMSAGARDGTFMNKLGHWVNRSRGLAGEIRQVDTVLRKAEDSIRLNPRGMRVAGAEVGLRHSLETLEHCAIMTRGIARALADSVRLVGERSLMRDPEARTRLADVLLTLSAAMRDYGRLVRDREAADPALLIELEDQFAAAAAQQHQLSELLGTDPAVWPVGWPLRGELISHLDRLRRELKEGVSSGLPQPGNP